VIPPSLDVRVERLLRDLAPQVLGAVIRRFRDFAASEDAVQEALLAAATQWPREGVPDNPHGWLVQVASRRIADHVRSEAARRRREAIVVSLVPPEEQIALAPDSVDAEEQDDTLVLLFMCCHPALTSSSAIALTLRAVGGLTTAEIARAFLVPEATMAQRISRAKQSIKTSGVPFQMPTPAERAERLGAVLHVLYLIFNEGYTTSSGPDLHRSDLSSEAIRLMRAVHALLPDDGEDAGLLALMRPHRRPAFGADRARGRADPARRAGSKPVGPECDCRGRRAHHRGAIRGLDRRLSTASRDRGRA
jgi:RNA polymerase sigma factor (sigma-70 family)